MRPMLATRGTRVPEGAGWRHEVKWDGMRDPGRRPPRPGGRRPLTSRNENDVSVSYPELRGIPGRDLLLDGEVVALADGRPSFAALAERMHVRSATRAAVLAERAPVTYLVFDLLRLDGRELAGEPLAARRELLDGLGLDDVCWQVPATYDDGTMLLEATRQQGLEGIVSKRLSSRYEYGARSRHWLKFPHRQRTCVGGRRLAARDRLDEPGRCAAGGRADARGRALPRPGRQRDRREGGAGAAGPPDPLTRATSPFLDEVPREDARGTTWVEPVLVVDVESLGLGAQGRLRQPSYRGVRADLGPEDLVAEP